MCGIAGFYGSFDHSLLDKMNQIQAHRGPDDCDTWYQEEHGIGFAHRRLAIIDLSPLGHQPMWDTDKQIVICYNGEIYNYRQLKQDLEADGYIFKSESDTEVILNLYLRDGVDCLAKLNGIFAFSLWDTRLEKMLLARDGLGIKPLYYTVTERGLLFASEMKVFVSEDDIDKTLDSEALLYYLGYLYAPYPHTPLQKVRKLPPGHAAWVTPQGIEESWEFYRIPYHQKIKSLTVKDATTQMQQLLKQAVERQMVADVPVGAFLSGGLDSSAITAFASQLVNPGDLNCFTIAFQGKEFVKEGTAADLPYARQVADHLGVKLNVIEAGPTMATRFEEMIYHLDEPQADPAPLNALFIAELARQNGIKVLLSGSGGDDIFSGYRRHQALAYEKYWGWLPRPARQGLKKLTSYAPVNQTWGRRMAKAFDYAGESESRRLASYFLWLNPQLIQQLAGPQLKQVFASADPLRPMLKVLNALPPNTPPLNKILALDSSHFLIDHNLNYTDKMGMATGVEVRVPLLDPDLISFATQLPPDMKQKGKIGKWIFKKAMEPYLPHHVIYRPKSGFGAPLRYWLKNDLAGYVADTLSTQSLKSRGLFDPQAVQTLIQHDKDSKIDATYTIFALVCIEIWCRLFLDGEATKFQENVRL